MPTPSQQNRPGLALKRAFDLIASIVGLLFLAVPFAIIAIAIKLDSPGPVFFRQERIGKDGKPFQIWKFRTMVHKATEQGLGITVANDDWRITRTGKLLRIWIDELPQILNVLRGEMSIAGPRPTLAYQVEQYTDHQRQRLLMRPGITSLAGVRGRNALSWEQRIELDVEYVKGWSIWLDASVVLRTFWVLNYPRRPVRPTRRES